MTPIRFKAYLENYFVTWYPWFDLSPASQSYSSGRSTMTGKQLGLLGFRLIWKTILVTWYPWFDLSPVSQSYSSGRSTMTGKQLDLL